MVKEVFSASLSSITDDSNRDSWSKWRLRVAVGLFCLLLVVSVYAIVYRIPDEMTMAKCVEWMSGNRRTALMVCDRIRGPELNLTDWQTASNQSGPLLSRP